MPGFGGHRGSLRVPGDRMPCGWCVAVRVRGCSRTIGPGSRAWRPSSPALTAQVGLDRDSLVKDLMDVRGVPTTAGCVAVAETAKPAAQDTACLAGARAAR